MLIGAPVDEADFGLPEFLQVGRDRRTLLRVADASSVARNETGPCGGRL
jgi:hypothetical protein